MRSSASMRAWKRAAASLVSTGPVGALRAWLYMVLFRPEVTVALGCPTRARVFVGQIWPSQPLSERSALMDFALTDAQQQIRDEVLRLCARFDDAYWLERDRTATFPDAFFGAMAEGNWLGVS